MENYRQTKRFENIVRLAVLFMAVLVCVAVISFVRLGQVRRENARYDELIASLKAENAKVEQSINNVTSDEYLEEQARYKLGMIKGDEINIEFKKG